MCRPWLWRLSEKEREEKHVHREPSEITVLPVVCHAFLEALRGTTRKQMVIDTWTHELALSLSLYVCVYAVCVCVCM